MPKMKTRKSLSARVHRTGGGKLMRMKVGRSHLRRRRTKRSKRLYDNKVGLHISDARRIRRVI